MNRGRPRATAAAPRSRTSTSSSPATGRTPSCCCTASPTTCSPGAGSCRRWRSSTASSRSTCPATARRPARSAAPLLNGYAALVLEVLDALGIHGRVSLIGNSMGAAVSAVLAAGHPERVDSAVLIGMPGLTGVRWRGGSPRPGRPRSRCARRCVRCPSPICSAASAGSTPMPPARVPAFSIPACCRPTAPGTTTAPAVRAVRDRPCPARRAAHRQLGRLLPRLRVPVLQVWGRHDRLVPPRRVVEREDLVVLPGCGHCPQLDAPDQLLGAVLPFLERNRSTQGQLLSRAAGG